MKRITNPNYIYILTFIVPFLVYSLQWSTLYPDLTIELLSFYVATFIIAFFIGLIIESVPSFRYKAIPVYRYNILVVLGMYALYILDCLYMGFIPLFAFSSGDAAFEGNINFGIPTIHVLLITFNMFYSVFLFHQYLSNRNWSLLLLYLSSFVPFVFLLQRSSIMYITLSSAFIFLISQKRLGILKMLGLSALLIAVLYIFGYLGNVRSSNGDPTFIPRASGATEKFLESSVPKEFYWGYLYMASPVAGLQNNINIEKNVQPDYLGFAVFEMIPDFISKKIATILSLTRREFNQLNSFLNVGTIYARTFSFLSWPGMFIIFIYLLILTNSFYLVMRKSFMFGSTGIALMFTMITLGNYDNSISYSASSFPLFYPFLFSVLRGIWIKGAGKLPLPKVSGDLSAT